MLINDVIKDLQSLPEHVRSTVHADVKFSFPLVSISFSSLKTLSFDDAGKATRLCLKIFKKPPAQNYTKDANGNKLGYRKVLWSAYTEKRKKLALEVAAKLAIMNITDVALLPEGYFVFHVDEYCFVSSFYKSDNPTEWRKINDHKVYLRKINEVNKKLDGRK